MSDSLPQVLARHLGGSGVVSLTPAVSGTTGRCHWVEQGTSGRFFLKTVAADQLAMLEAERAGLEGLARAGCVRVPRPLAHGVADGCAWLLMEGLELRPATAEAERTLGRQLARQHRLTRGRFGWDRDNYLGVNPQPNPPGDDWVEYFVRHRLRHQLRIAELQGLDAGLTGTVDQVLVHLDWFFDDYRPQASLLHGDLWGGNWGMLPSGQPVIFDPACYYGDREVDLAQTLNGGFGPAFLEAYHEEWPVDAGFQRRRYLYNLYMVLNEVNRVGRAGLPGAQNYLQELLKFIEGERGRGRRAPPAIGPAVQGGRAQPSDYRLPDNGPEPGLEYADYRGGDPLKVVVLGGCMTQFAADALARLGARSGFAVDVQASWPTTLSLLDDATPDLVVLQLSNTWLLGPLWDRGAFHDDAARAEMVEFIKESCTLTIRDVRQRAPAALLLAHGFSRPMVSPLGIHEFRHEYHFDRIIFELNEHIRRLIRTDPSALYLDEERIFSNLGKGRLLDHLLAPFSHHGPIDWASGPSLSPGLAETFGLTRTLEVAHVLAREYLDHYVAWKGVDRIKCVIVDLDHTLWPQAIGEAGLVLEDPELRQSLMYGVWAGIHQALQILKSRGVLLATASRNDRETALAEWAKLKEWSDQGEVEHLLLPDDFVLHEIHWGSKSESVARILAALGVSDADALFIDDSPEEREEVRQHFPRLTVLGDNLYRVRGHLLLSPRLQSDQVTREAGTRTRLVKAQLVREATRITATSRQEFLAGLNIVLRVRRLGADADLGRCVELLARTNQFNITLRRRTIDELRALCALPDVTVAALEVSDRFGAHGTVGVCILQGEEVTDFAMSCRVISLDPAVPFLRAALLEHRRERYRGRIVDGPRNQPCRSLFADAGFRRGEGGEWWLESLGELRPVDPGIYRTEIV